MAAITTAINPTIIYAINMPYIAKNALHRYDQSPKLSITDT